MKRIWLVGANQHNDLQQSGKAATDWGNNSQEEGSGKYDYCNNLPDRN